MRHGIELFLKVGKLRSALPGARRIARLRHEPVDHAVKDIAVVEALPRQSLDARDMVRCPVLHQPDRNALAVRQVEIEDVLQIRRRIIIDRSIGAALWHNLVLRGGGHGGHQHQRGKRASGNQAFEHGNPIEEDE